MKKNSKATYIILAVVIIIWGIVLYRIYKIIFPGAEALIINKEQKKSGEVKSDKNDHFSLMLNYADPFLGKSFGQESTNKPFAKKAKTPLKVKGPDIKIDWSFISYVGLIKNQTNKKQVALVSIHGKEYMISEGDQVQDVTFIKNYRDSIKVSCQKVVCYIKK